MAYREIEGDLIKLAKEGKFDVITHGCNCFCVMRSGIAPQMAKAFGCDEFELEHERLKGDINKLGCIDHEYVTLPTGVRLWVVNSYTQYDMGTHKVQLDYSALTLCMKKINHYFKGQHIGLPQIGCGLAGGNWRDVKTILQTYLPDCNVTVVIYKP